MAAADLFTTYARTPAPPADDAFAVTPSDSVAFTAVASALYIGVTGDVTLITSLGNTVLFKAVPAGVTLPIRCTQVKATATTATSIVGLI